MAQNQPWTPLDEQSWSMTKASIAEDGQIGHRFLVFLNLWLGAAEKILSEAPVWADKHKTVRAAQPTPAEAVREGLKIAEDNLGYVNVHFMGQLLAVICTYWLHGDDCARGLSLIELKICGEALRLKLDEMEREAEQGADTGPTESGDTQGDPHLHADTQADAIDPLPEPGGPAEPGTGVGAGGRAGRLGSAGPDSHGEALRRAQLRGRERRERAMAEAGNDDDRSDDGGPEGDGVPA